MPREFFKIRWLQEDNAKFSVDEIPKDWFGPSPKQGGQTHKIKSKSGSSFAICAISVKGRIAKLKYPDNEENRGNSIHVGTLEIKFANPARTGISSLIWNTKPLREHLDYEILDDIEDDIKIIKRNNEISTTEKEQLIAARRGQGKFRAQLETRWHGRCAVSGVSIRHLLRASHIRPWKNSNNDQRLSKDNGLLLIANLDALFDKGLISFADNGKLLLHPDMSELEKSELKKLDHSWNRRTLDLKEKPLSKEQKSHLRFHREKYGFA